MSCSGETPGSPLRLPPWPGTKGNSTKARSPVKSTREGGMLGQEARSPTAESLRPPLEHRGEDSTDSANTAPSGADTEAGDNDTVLQ